MRASMFQLFALAMALALPLALPTSAHAKGGGGAPPKVKPPPPAPAAPATPAAAAAKPKDCVELAASWDAAVALGKGMGAPIVLHAHAFASAASWEMHDVVMCAKGYRDFAVDNAVDVILLAGVEDGVANKDKRAATYEATTPTGKVRYLVELPGLTLADLSALEGSKAKSFVTSTLTPFTALIDPFTEAAGTTWSAPISAKELEDGITAMKKTIEAAHGKGGSRKDVKALLVAAVDAAAKSGKGDFSGAIALLTTVRGSKSSTSEGFKKTCDDEFAKVVAAAQAALDAIEARKGTDVLGARKDLALLIPKLKGTGLESKASALMDNLK